MRQICSPLKLFACTGRVIAFLFGKFPFVPNGPGGKSYSQHPPDIGNRYYNSIDCKNQKPDKTFTNTLRVGEIYFLRPSFSINAR